ncbi:MAG: hypothetical protein ABOK23_06870 [Candidatus Methanoperedens sp.]|nr:hypothetical protein [Candidatus Methanoperedens sp.]
MEYKLQIEFIFKIPNKSRFGKIDFPIQNRLFMYGLNIKNIGENVFPGATLKNISVKDAAQTIEYNVSKEFSIRSLNPGESIQIWLEQITTYATGVFWFLCDVIPVGDDVITTYQKDKYSGQLEPYSKKNKWFEHFFIQGQFELQQARTNTYLLILTFLTALQGIFGLDNIGRYFLKIVQSILLFFADVIGKLLH